MRGCFIKGWEKPMYCLYDTDYRCQFLYDSIYLGEFYCCLTHREFVPDSSGTVEIPEDCPIEEEEEDE